MLILNRKEGESLLIGEDITITVLSIEGNRAKIAISAPKAISILRQELVDAANANMDSSHEEADPSELFSLLSPSNQVL